MTTQTYHENGEELILFEVTLTLCNLCLEGAGGECHVPGCALWMNRAPDLPLRDVIVIGRADAG